MARNYDFLDPQFESDSPEKARRRAIREFNERVAARAIWIYDNDDSVGTMTQARKKAREELEIIMQVEKGLLNPETGELTSKGEKVLGSTDDKDSGRGRTSQRSRTKKSAGRPVRDSVRQAVRTKTARAVIRPFGNVASVGWTLLTGGLSLVLLYRALDEHQTVGAFLRGIGTGVRQFSDPYVPLIPTARESAPPSSIRRTVRRSPATGSRPIRRHRRARRGVASP